VNSSRVSVDWSLEVGTCLHSHESREGMFHRADRPTTASCKDVCYLTERSPRPTILRVTTQGLISHCFRFILRASLSRLMGPRCGRLPPIIVLRMLVLECNCLPCAYY